jgi:cytochrome c oxidase subunit 4
MHDSHTTAGHAASGHGHGGHGHGGHGDAKHAPVPQRVFILVWVALLVLTAVTVAASVGFPGRVGIGVAMIVTPIKAALILMWFMHLKYEKPVFKFMFLSAMVVLAIVMGLTFFDYSFLGEGGYGRSI